MKVTVKSVSLIRGLPLEWEWVPTRHFTTVSTRLHPVYTVFPCHVDFEPMDSDALQSKRRQKFTSALDVAIEALNIAKEVSSVTPAKVVFGSVSVVLAMIKVGFQRSRLLVLGADLGRVAGLR